MYINLCGENKKQKVINGDYDPFCVYNIFILINSSNLMVESVAYQQCIQKQYPLQESQIKFLFASPPDKK